ncbi:hypothetical protein [Paenibacillus ferrarius]|uniref:hypothetical protein n=1 Tax=Paenibacillus ferrarius TaxID=1469647 RepID=UPI003D2C6181
MQWRESIYRGVPSVVGESAGLRVELVPGRGGKVVSFSSRVTGKEWVFQTDVPLEPLRYGMNWDDGDRGGWDEMFPTILACPCPDEPWRGTGFPDHGEVWSLPWSYAIEGDQLRMWVHGVKVPYVLSKTYTLQASRLCTRYEVRNPTPFAFSYLWCAHNLLAIEPGMKVLVPHGLDTVQYQYSHRDRLTDDAYGRSAYPIVQRGSASVDLSVMEEAACGHAEKYWFEGALTEGKAGVVDPVSGEALWYTFDSNTVPYLAVWANYGAFNGDYTFALEPATGYLDDVYMAKVMNKAARVAPYSRNEWLFDISIQRRTDDAV